MALISRLPPGRWRDYRRLRLEALRNEPLAFGSSYGEERCLGEKEWKKRISDTFFAVHEGEPVGMIVCSFNGSVKFRHVAEIFSFYVTPAHRGEGVGAALFDHALQTIQRHRRIVKVRLYVNREQRAAVQLYRRAGFVTTGTLEREMKVGGRFYTMLMMEKALR